MVYSTSTKSAKELFCSKCTEIVDNKRPEVKYIVSSNTIAFFYDYYFSAEELGLDSRPQATRPSSYY